MKYKIGETVLLKNNPNIWEIATFSDSKYLIQREYKAIVYCLLVKEEDLTPYKENKMRFKLWKI